MQFKLQYAHYENNFCIVCMKLTNLLQASSYIGIFLLCSSILSAV